MNTRRTSLEQAGADHLLLAERGPAGWYALVGGESGDLMSWGGQVLVHRSATDLELLFPGTRVERLAPGCGERVMPLAAHPDLSAILWPIQAADFRRSHQ